MKRPKTAWRRGLLLAAAPGPSMGAILIYLLLVATPGPSMGTTLIYRFGGTDLPPPPEAQRAGVEFRQMRWADLHALSGRQTQRVRMRAMLGPLLYSSGPNIAPELQRAGSTLKALFDRDLFTLWTAQSYLCKSLPLPCNGRYGRPGIININLDDKVIIERIGIVSGGVPFAVNPLRIVQDLGVTLSLTPLKSEQKPRASFVAEINDNRQRALYIDMPTEERTAAVQIALSEHSEPWEISEIQIFAKEGTATHQAFYTSNIIDFGRPAVWGAMRWSLRREAESHLFLQTRSGADTELLRYWRYTGIGDQKIEVNKADYDQLRSGEKAGSTYNYDSWTPWTPRFEIAQKEPPVFSQVRRAFQFHLEFLSAGEKGTQIDFLEFRASDAAVSEVVGELDPIQVRAGELTDFTYTLKPRLQPDDAGFDRLEIRALAARLAGAQAVRIDGFEMPFAVETLEDQQLVVSFPRVGQEQSDALIEVFFKAQVLRYGGAFTARLADSNRPFDVLQPVAAGNALDEVDSDRVWIETSIAVQSVLTVRAIPSAFTPNGDGINDQVHLVYDLFETTGAVPVVLEIRDLAGRRVRQVYTGTDRIGHYEHLWDGRDEQGRLVAPGIYLYSAVADINRNSFVEIGPLQVIY